MASSMLSPEEIPRITAFTVSRALEHDPAIRAAMNGPQQFAEEILESACHSVQRNSKYGGYGAHMVSSFFKQDLEVRKEMTDSPNELSPKNRVAMLYKVSSEVLSIISGGVISNDILALGYGQRPLTPQGGKPNMHPNEIRFKEVIINGETAWVPTHVIYAGKPCQTFDSDTPPHYTEDNCGEGKPIPPLVAVSSILGLAAAVVRAHREGSTEVGLGPIYDGLGSAGDNMLEVLNGNFSPTRPIGRWRPAGS